MEIIHTKNHGCTSYPVGDNMVGALKQAKIYNNWIRNHLKNELENCEQIHLIGRGSSGTILCSLLSAKLPKSKIIKVLHYKKPGECSHSEHHPISKDWSSYKTKILRLIVDDFIGSGATLTNLCKDYFEVNGFDKPIDAILVEGTNRDALIRDGEFLKEYQKYINYLILQ